MMAKHSVAVVSDFDGTFTKTDVGNLISERALGPKWHDLYRKLRSGELNLKSYQMAVWDRMPVTSENLAKWALEASELRPGVLEFLESCQEKSIPVYIASCGLRPYIDAVLNDRVPKHLRSAIKEIKCHDATFDSGVLRFIPAEDRTESPFPLDKGLYCRSLRDSVQKIIGIGNGTSDQTFAGSVDLLCATESLAKYCDAKAFTYRYFEDFFDIAKDPYVREILGSAT